ncbi:MAG: hypothetical protein ACRC7G_04725 [Beijerinckiaceae bacterium]
MIVLFGVSLTVASVSLLALAGWLMPVSGVTADAAAALFALSGAVVVVSLEEIGTAGTGATVGHESDDA